MARHTGCWLALIALLLVAGAARAQKAEVTEATNVSEYPDHYPEAWAQIDLRPVIDNERLFKKYKSCVLVDSPKGCPRDVVQFKKILPEVLETTCAKCLPEHIDKVKEVLEYVCQKRKADFDEVRNAKDPTGELQKKFQAKYGNIPCLV